MIHTLRVFRKDYTIKQQHITYEKQFFVYLVSFESHLSSLLFVSDVFYRKTNELKMRKMPAQLQL